MDALSKLTAAVPKAAQRLSRRSQRSQAVIKAKRIKGDVVSLIQPNLHLRTPPLTPGVKSLIQKELFKDDLDSEPASSRQPQNITDHLDTSIESFFSQRPYSLSTFNEYLMVLSHQGKADQALAAVEKMRLMGFRPNSLSFIHLMRSCAGSRDVETAERLFDKALETCGDKKLGQLYSTLISVHAVTGNTEYIEALLLEKKRKGCAITVVDYTCQMHGLLHAQRPKEAIAVYQAAKNLVRPDEFFMTIALKACARDSQAELALTIWQDLGALSTLDNCGPYDELIMALAKRKEYAEKAIETWRQMRAKGVVPSARTYNGVLTATSRLGDLPLAKEIITDMKVNGVNMDKSRYGLLMQIYGAASPRVDIENKAKFVEDCWELFRSYEQTGGEVGQYILNSILSMHIQAGMIGEVEGMVLPLFDTYKVAKTKHTYRHLMKLYQELRQPDKVFHIWETLKREQITPDFYMCNCYLETGYRFNQVDRVVEGLQALKKVGGMPRYCVIKRLNDRKDLPPRVWVELQEFKHFYSHLVERKYGRRDVPAEVLERAQR